jgi:hypothetical protein
MPSKQGKEQVVRRVIHGVWKHARRKRADHQTENAIADRCISTGCVMAAVFYWSPLLRWLWDTSTDVMPA